MTRRLKNILAACCVAAAAIVVAPIVAMQSTALARQGAQQAVTLKVGDKAPALTGTTWVKGEPVKEFEPGKVYIMEFWATWCGPCITAMPHLSETAAKYKDKGVVVIAQNIWERDDSKVKPFVEKMGDKMAFAVVMDDKSSNKEGVMATTWMRAAGRDGIPTSMIVDQKGVLAWMGHPSQLDAVLEKIVEGKYDAKTEGSLQEKKEKANQALGEAIQAGDIDKAMVLIDDFAKIEPSLADRVPLIKFSIYLQAGQPEKAYAMTDAVVASKASASELNEIAWAILTEESVTKRDPVAAEKLATKAVELTNRKDAGILDTLAKAKFEQGHHDDAIAVQKEAIVAAADDMKEELQETLKTYEAAKK